MLRRAAVLLAGNVVVSILALVTVAFLARTLGPGGMGGYQSVVRWGSVLLIAGSFSLGQAAAYHTRDSDADSLSQTVTGLLLASIAQSALIAAALVAVGRLVFGSDPLVVSASWWFVLLVPANLATTYLLHMLRAQLQMKRFTVVRVIQAASFFLGVLVLVGLDAVNLSTVMAMLAASTALGLGIALWYARLNRWLVSAVGPAEFKPVFVYGLRMHPGVFGRELNKYSDQLLISVALTLSSLGLYAGAVAAVGVLSMVSMAFLYLAQPEIQSAPSARKGETAAQLCRLTVGVMVPLAVVFALAAPVLVTGVYGSAFQGSVLPAQILSGAAVVEALGVTLSGVLIGLGQGHIVTVAQLVALAISIVMLLMFVPSGGIVAASVVSVITYVIAATIMLIRLTRLLGLGIRQVLVPTPRDLRAFRLLASPTSVSTDA